MRLTVVEQDGVRVTQEQPDNVVIEMNGTSITLTEENTELLRVMLYEAYRSKRWKCSRAEKSARNKALWALAKAQGKRKPDVQTEEAYKRMKEQAAEEISNIEIIIPDFQEMGISDFLK
ncbi:hypothetical protein [Bacteroides sp. UBA939]|uniref:hypothetical protein n=1 Tax=Bacteroides sp. UBA939 TaxID=1946092 RepID=UPI0025C5D491|nr:hypothetical protein [Bacteroides sp. UBA939]